jgi:hypothetical protein
MTSRCACSHADGFGRLRRPAAASFSGGLGSHPDPADDGDEFRLVRFERRWRIISIDLSKETGAIQQAR